MTGGGAGGTGGGVAQVDAGTDAGIDAGPVDPFDDGGTFVPGDICNRAIPVAIDGGVGATTVALNLATATDQYVASCEQSPVSGNDVIYKLELTSPKGLLVTATRTTGPSQEVYVSLLSSPCAANRQAACDGATDVGQLVVPRVAAGTWYVLVDAVVNPNTAADYSVRFELIDPLPAPPNDTCATAEEISFVGDAASVAGTTENAFNDSAGSPLSCSAQSANRPEVYYRFTLTQPHDVQVIANTPFTSLLSPVVALTDTCGPGAVERSCLNGPPGLFIGRNLQPGTYFVVVDQNGLDSGEFTLDLSLLPPTPIPSNDTCASPATLVPNVTQMAQVSAGRLDYRYSCDMPFGGDVVYQFTTTAPQKVTLTVDGPGGANSAISLRAAPCEDSTNEVKCSATFASPEVLLVPNLPAGTYFVLVASSMPASGAYGTSLKLDPPVLPPPNDTCTTPAILVPNVTQTVDVAAGVQDYSTVCATSSKPDVVYQFTLTQARKVTLTASGTGSGDAFLELRSARCEDGPAAACADATSSGAETLTVNNLAAGTYYVVLGTRGFDTQFGIALTTDVPVAPASCSAVGAVTLVNGAATRSVNLSTRTADIDDLCEGFAPTGNNATFSVQVPAGKTLTVTATGVGQADPMLFLRSSCASAPSLSCSATSGPGGTETVTFANTGAAAVTRFVVVKAFDASGNGVVNLTFSAP